jgi:hypothetical protein
MDRVVRDKRSFSGEARISAFREKRHCPMGRRAGEAPRKEKGQLRNGKGRRTTRPGIP